MPNDDFNPHSPNAMFSRILERLDQQDRTYKSYHAATLERFDGLQTGLQSVEGRVGILEKGQWKQRGFVAAIAIGITGLWQVITGNSGQ